MVGFFGERPRIWDDDEDTVVSRGRRSSHESMVK
jgi:hypothetical protein